MMAPAVVLLLGWMLVPLTMTLYFSFKKYLPLRGGDLGWVGFDNYVRFVTSSSFWPAVQATLVSSLAAYVVITVVLRGPAGAAAGSADVGPRDRAHLVIAPFFVMPTVSALVWKNMFMDPVNGLLAHLWRFVRGRTDLEWLTQASSAIDHHDRLLAMAAFCHTDLADRYPVAGQRAAGGRRDGWCAAAEARFCLHHPAASVSRDHGRHADSDDLPARDLRRDLRDHAGIAFGTRTLTYLIFQRVLESQNVGLGSAGGVYAIILANIVAMFLMRIVGKNLDA